VCIYRRYGTIKAQEVSEVKKFFSMIFFSMFFFSMIFFSMIFFSMILFCMLFFGMLFYCALLFFTIYFGKFFSECSFPPCPFKGDPASAGQDLALSASLAWEIIYIACSFQKEEISDVWKKGLTYQVQNYHPLDISVSL